LSQGQLPEVALKEVERIISLIASAPRDVVDQGLRRSGGAIESAFIRHVG
jgi:hypothetical protein